MQATVDINGRATIPKAIREYLRLKPGDRIKFFMHPNGNVILLPALPVTALRGIVKAPAAAGDDRGNERGCRQYGRRVRAPSRATEIIEFRLSNESEPA